MPTDSLIHISMRLKLSQRELGGADGSPDQNPVT